MKHHRLTLFFRFMILMILSASLSACGQKRRPTASSPYKAVVIVLTSVDSSGRAHFGLEEKSFFAMNDLDSLDGTYLKILRGGELSIKEVNGSIVSADSFTGGENPDLRYTIDSGVVVASDYSTLAMLSSFFQFDYIYSKVLDVFGVEPSKLQEKLPGGKHTVLFEPQITFDLDNIEGSAGIKLNAAFSPKDKQFLLFQRSGIESVPLSGNLQVISHEFGHSLFDYSFFGGTFDDKNFLGETFALRGLNEGWADFVSWNFTGSADILRSSIAITAVADERFITNTTFKWDDIAAQSVSKSVYDRSPPANRCIGSFYCLGTVFARSLLEAKASLSAVDARTYANGILVSLQSAQAEIRAMPSTIVPVAVEKDTEAPDSLAKWSEQGKFCGAFLRALVKNAPSEMKSALCTRFIANFGLDGFPTAARDGMCL